MSLRQMAIGEQFWLVSNQFHRWGTRWARFSPCCASFTSPCSASVLSLRYVVLWDPLGTHMYAAQLPRELLLHWKEIWSVSHPSPMTPAETSLVRRLCFLPCLIPLFSHSWISAVVLLAKLWDTDFYLRLCFLRKAEILPLRTLKLVREGIFRHR